MKFMEAVTHFYEKYEVIIIGADVPILESDETTAKLYPILIPPPTWVLRYGDMLYAIADNGNFADQQYFKENWNPIVMAEQIKMGAEVKYFLRFSFIYPFISVNSFFPLFLIFHH